MRLIAANLCIDRGGRRVLSDVSFDLREGALLVTGSNGTGKSSLLRVLAGLLQPASGRVVLTDAAEADPPLHYLGHRDGLKAQLTARENLHFAAGFLGGSEQPMRDPDDALAAFGLSAAADVPTAWLSAGQKRRVALARLLVAPRALWLLDEPTTGLDAEAVALFEAVATHYLAHGGLIVAATHMPLRLQYRELRLGMPAAIA